MNISSKQLNLLHHTLGLRPDQRQPYRNHFVAGPGHHDQADLLALVCAGLMTREPAPKFCAPGDEVFRCTEDGAEYALERLPKPPKRTRYDEYLDADYGHSFAEWLCIDPPEVETRTDWSTRKTEYRMVRNRYGISRRSSTVVGEWKPTKKEAKASYKAALKKHKDQVRSWRTGVEA